jgi:hypothetical protein
MRPRPRGAPGQVVERTEGAEGDGEPHLGGELLAWRPPEGLLPESPKDLAGEEAVGRGELGLADPGAAAQRPGVEAEGGEAGEHGAGGGRGHDLHSQTVDRARTAGQSGGSAGPGLRALLGLEGPTAPALQ